MHNLVNVLIFVALEIPAEGQQEGDLLNGMPQSDGDGELSAFEFKHPCKVVQLLASIPVLGAGLRRSLLSGEGGVQSDRIAEGEVWFDKLDDRSKVEVDGERLTASC